MLNLAIIMGRLTKDPELRQTPNNVSTATFNVAVERDYKKEGQEKETDFFDIVAWRNTAEFICKNFVKGQTIALYGRLQKRSYEDSNGVKRTVTEVIADSVYFCGPKMQNDAAPAGNGFDTNLFPPVQNNGFTPDFSSFSPAFGQQPAPQFQQPTGQNIQQPAMTPPQYQQPMPQAQQPSVIPPNIQPAPTMQGYMQTPPQQSQQPAVPQAAAAGGLPYNPNEWTNFEDDDLPF